MLYKLTVLQGKTEPSASRGRPDGHFPQPAFGEVTRGHTTEGPGCRVHLKPSTEEAAESETRPES